MPSNSSLLTEMTCKKVQVPVHAISRVIGRAGSNINAIRATTGAHIEVEKQGSKTQSDRCITIKGLPDATKQAHYLISALIKDPDVDILQMLPKVNPSAKPQPLIVNSWDKNTPLTQSPSIAQSSSSSTTSSSGSSQKGGGNSGGGGGGSNSSGKPMQLFTNTSGKPSTSNQIKSNSNLRSGQSGSKSNIQSLQNNRMSTNNVPSSNIMNSSNRSMNEYNTTPQKRVEAMEFHRHL